MRKLHVEDISQVLVAQVDKVECGPESEHMRNVIDHNSGPSSEHAAILRPVLRLSSHQLSSV